MSEEILRFALDGAAERLNTGDRPWLVGVAHLAEMPLDAGEFAPEAVQSVIDIARSTVGFPTGPLHYSPSEAVVVEANPEYQLIRVRSDDQPHLEMQLGLGIAGFVALGLTRSDVFDGGSSEPGGVIIADLESVIGDLVVLAIGSALELGYRGPIDLAINVVDTRPGVELVYYAIDDETGGLVRADVGGRPFEPLLDRLMFLDDTGPRDVHAAMRQIAVRLSGQFGVGPQLVSEVLAEDHEEYVNDPLRGRARGAGGRPATPEGTGGA